MFCVCKALFLKRNSPEKPETFTRDGHESVKVHYEFWPVHILRRNVCKLKKHQKRSQILKQFVLKQFVKNKILKQFVKNRKQGFKDLLVPLVPL